MGKILPKKREGKKNVVIVLSFTCPIDHSLADVAKSDCCTAILGCELASFVLFFRNQDFPPPFLLFFPIFIIIILINLIKKQFLC